MTNLERIKSMTAEEIVAEFYDKETDIWIAPRDYCSRNVDAGTCKDDCVPCFVNWFNSEYMGDDNIKGNPSDKKIVEALKEVGTVMTASTECSWCYKHSRKGMIPMKKHEMEWVVMDEDFGQYVHINLIHYCPFCGRPLDD